MICGDKLSDFVKFDFGQKDGTHRQTDKHQDNATYSLNRPRDRFSKKDKVSRLENVKKLTQAKFLKTKSYPKAC